MKRKILSLIAAIGLTLACPSHITAMDHYEIIDKATYFQARAVRLEAVRLEEEQIEANYFKKRSALIGNNIAFQKFVDVYSPPADLLKTLIRDEKKVHDVSLDPSNPLIAKGPRQATSRIILANRLRNYIQQKNFKTVSVPQKYIFLAGDEWTVVAERVKNTKSPTPITLDRIQELTDIATEFNFDDFHYDNVMEDETGHYFFIDTELDSFSNICTVRDQYLRICMLQAYIISGKLGNGVMTSDACAWFNQKITDLRDQRENEPNRISSVGARSRTDLDHPEVDTQAVYDYIKEHKSFYNYF